VTEPEQTPLEKEIRARIARDGPVPVDAFMSLCLYDPEHGYYRRRPAFGAGGDFVTAPEISQMFGELLGLWAATVWHALGEPSPVRLIELGPGRGTMMADALRAMRAVPAFRKAARVHLVEISVDLQMRQRQTLAEVDDVMLRWHAKLDEVPAGPSIILANEFFDALPVRQAERRATGWHERAVTINAGDTLALTVAAEPLVDFEAGLPRTTRRAAIGDIFEWRTDQFAADVARRVVAGGAALAIDYGHLRTAVGDTFQAVRSHRYASPLALPGLTDLTAHVDFEALGRMAQEAGARVHGPIEQGAFLKRLGIEARAAALEAQADDARRPAIAAALQRLAGNGRGDMGSQFKVIGFSMPQLTGLPGFGS
jgi:NADH dehydrogenase [ubiquinone] 1 alpha subcomplex assembly factor 7